MSNRAWVTLATNDSYGLGALVLAHSLRRVGSVYPAAILITPAVTEPMRDRLRAVFAEVIIVDVLDSRDAAHLALLQRPELGITFTKIHCWSLTQYEKCVFLDADALVVQNCDELFEREELSAAPDVGWPDCFNSGVFVYKPSKETFDALIKFAQERGSFDGGDQGLLNSFFSDWAHGDISKHLPFLYNVTSAAFYSYLPALKHFGQNLKIIHFIGATKPWLQSFNWESRSVEAPGHLKGFLQIWWDLFVSSVHPQLDVAMSGVAGNLARVTPGAAGTQREALDELSRRQGWEAGNIDYMGADSFDNIWAKISQTLSRSSPPKQPSPPKEPTPSPKQPSPPKESATSPQQPPVQKESTPPPKQPSPPKESKQPSPPKEPTPQPKQPSPAKESIPQPKQTSPPKETTPQPKQPSPAKESIPQPKQPSPPKETTPQPKQPSPPKEPTVQPEQPSPPKEPTPQTEQPSSAEETTPQTKQPSPPKEPTPQPKQPSPPKDSAPQPKQPTPPKEAEVVQPPSTEAAVEITPPTDPVVPQQPLQITPTTETSPSAPAPVTEVPVIEKSVPSTESTPVPSEQVQIESQPVETPKTEVPPSEVSSVAPVTETTSDESTASVKTESESLPVAKESPPTTLSSEIPSTPTKASDLSTASTDSPPLAHTPPKGEQQPISPPTAAKSTEEAVQETRL